MRRWARAVAGALPPTVVGREANGRRKTPAGVAGAGRFETTVCSRPSKVKPAHQALTSKYYRLLCARGLIARPLRATSPLLAYARKHLEPLRGWCRTPAHGQLA
jgi:hypothetical protein